MKKLDFKEEMEMIESEIKLLKTRNLKINKNIKSLDIVKTMLSLEFQKSTNEVEYLETTVDIKNYKLYLASKENLEQRVENNKISESNFLKEIESLNNKYSGINKDIVMEYITHQKRAKSYKQQFIELEYTEKDLENEKLSNSKRINELEEMKANLVKNNSGNKENSGETLEERLHLCSKDNKNDADSDSKTKYLDVCTPEVIKESMATCLD